jgi:hypothetical protein
VSLLRPFVRCYSPECVEGKFSEAGRSALGVHQAPRHPYHHLHGPILVQELLSYQCAPRLEVESEGNRSEQPLMPLTISLPNHKGAARLVSVRSERRSPRLHGGLRAGEALVRLLARGHGGFIRETSEPARTLDIPPTSEVSPDEAEMERLGALVHKYEAEILAPPD